MNPATCAQVHNHKASVSYHEGESPAAWSDPATGTSFSLGHHAEQRGAYMQWKQSAPPRVAHPSNLPPPLAARMRDKMDALNRGFGGAGSGGRTHVGVGRFVKDLVSRHKVCLCVCVRHV